MWLMFFVSSPVGSGPYATKRKTFQVLSYKVKLKACRCGGLASFNCTTACGSWSVGGLQAFGASWSCKLKGIQLLSAWDSRHVSG